MSALEFALLALPFFLMIAAIVELGIIFFEQSAFTVAVDQAARAIRTNNAPTGGWSQQSIASLICNAAPLPNCAASVKLNVTPVNLTNGPFTPPAPTNPPTVNTGVACGTEMVQATYPWTILIPINNLWVATGPGGGSGLSFATWPLTATAVFINEPYSTTPCAPSPG